MLHQLYLGKYEAIEIVYDRRASVKNAWRIPNCGFSWIIRSGWVRKPLFSREGANVELVTLSGEKISEPGPYADSPFIRQKLQPLPKFGDSYTMIGSWVVGNSAAGIGIREDNSLITKDSSRFLPHIILD